MIQKLMNSLSLGFNYDKDAELELNRFWYEFLLEKKLKYPGVYFEGEPINVLNPQLIFGKNDFTNYCNFFYERNTIDKMSLPCLVGYNSNSVIVQDFASEIIHLLISGQTGSGKTSALYGILFGLMWLNLPKWLQIDIFSTKGVSMFEDLCNVYSTYESIKLATKELESSLKKRMDALSKDRSCHSIDLYNKSKKVPLRHRIIIIDEFASIYKGLEGADKEQFKIAIELIAAQGRSLGFYLILMPQRPDVSSIPSGAKSQMVSSLTFTLRSVVDGQTADLVSAKSLLPQHAFLRTNSFEGVIRSAPMHDSYPVFFCERIRKTMVLNGFDTCFK